MVAVGVGGAILNLRQEDSSMRRECFGVLGTLRPREGQRPPKVTQQVSAKVGKGPQCPAPRLVPGQGGDMQMVMRTAGAGRWAGIRRP